MIRAVALVLTVLTGFSGLIYEVTWQKYLATLLGSHSEATAAVLGIFLGGLSVGYALFGRIVRRLFARASTQSAPTRLLVLYGVIEAGIGIWALLFPTLFSGVHALSLQLALDSRGLGFALDVFFTVLLVGPPAVLMGARSRSSPRRFPADSKTRRASTPSCTASIRPAPLPARSPPLSS